MDRVRVELLAPLVLEESRRAAQRAVLVASADKPWWTGVMTGLGQLLVRAGERLKTVECRRPAIAPVWIVAEACGCGE